MAARKGRKKTSKRKPARKPNVGVVFKELESAAQEILGHISALKKRIKMDDCLEIDKPRSHPMDDCLEIDKP